MTDDISLFRFDIDAEAIRALLEALGVPPAALDELDTETDGASSDSSTRTPPSRERTGPRVGETPPPGAGEQVPPSEADEDDDGRRRLLLLAGAGVTVLAALTAVGAFRYRRRSGASELPTPDVDLSTPDLDRVTGLVGGDDDTVDDAEPEPTPERERPESAVDAAPLIGMAALAVGAVVRRAVTADGE